MVKGHGGFDRSQPDVVRHGLAVTADRFCAQSGKVMQTEHVEHTGRFAIGIDATLIFTCVEPREGQRRPSRMLALVVEQDPKMANHGCAISNATEGSVYTHENGRTVRIAKILGRTSGCYGSRPMAVELRTPGGLFLEPYTGGGLGGHPPLPR